MVDSEQCQTFSTTGSSKDSSSVDSKQTISSFDDDTDEPEGQARPSLRAWLTVFGSFLSLFCTFGQMNSFGTFQSWYATHQLHDNPPSTISLIGTLQLWAFFFSGGVIGWYFDRYGPRAIMCLGTVVYVFSIMVTSVCRQYYQYILVQGILFGLGVGLLFFPCVISVTTHFTRYRGTAMGIAIAGTSAGGVVFPIMLQRLFVAVGFANAVRISGCLCFACCAVAVSTVTSNRSPSASAKGASHTITWYKNCFKDVRYMLLISGSCLISLGLYIPFFYIVDFVQAGSSVNKTNSLSTYILAIMNAGGFFGRILPSVFSDRIGCYNTIVPCAFLGGLSCLALWLPAASASFAGNWETSTFEILFAVAFGFFSGGFISLVTVCVTRISDMREAGSRVGLLYSLSSFPALAGGPIAGAILQHAHGSGKNSFVGMIVFSSATVIAGSGFILWTRYKMDSRLLTVV